MVELTATMVEYINNNAEGQEKVPFQVHRLHYGRRTITREQGTYSGQDQPIKTTRTNGKLIPRILDTEAVQSGHIFLEEFDSSMQAGEATSLRHTAMNREIVLPSSIVYVPSFV